MEGPTSKKTNEPPKEGGPQGEHEVSEPPPLARSILNKID